MTHNPDTDPDSRLLRACICGSGLEPWWHYDARGIELFKGCEACEADKLAQYRPDILTNPGYDCDEAIDPDGDEW